MSQSLAQILLHTVFSTKERRPLLRDDLARTQLHSYLGGILKQHGCQPITVGGVEDHVHLLFSGSRILAPSDLVQALKRSSSLWIKEQFPDQSDFAWQNGYGIFSIGYSQIGRVQDYITRQKDHHQRHDFKSEFRRLLKAYGIGYDERYVWD